MPRRVTNLGRQTRHAAYSRRRLLNMTEEERTSLRERNRLSNIQRRNAEPAERRAVRLENARLRAQQLRSVAKDLVRYKQNERARVIVETHAQRTADLIWQYHCFAFRQPDEESLTETLKVEIADEHEEYSEVALAPPIDQLATAVQSISCAVKTEPPDEEPHTFAQTHTHTDTATSSGTADSLHSELWLSAEIKTEDNPHDPTSDDVKREPPGS